MKNKHGGDLLRQWRQRRRRSQLDLALDTGISARHLSFVETGRSRPSRGLLLALAEQLDVPLRERNALMLAAGYAPTYAESDLASAETQQARDALERLLAGHEPYPAVVLDRWGDVVLTNRAVGPLLEGVDAELLQPPINTYRLSLHPKGMVSRIRNRAEWTAHLGHRLTRLARLTGDARLAELLAEIRTYPGVVDALDGFHEPTTSELLLTLQLAHPAGDLRLHSTVDELRQPARRDALRADRRVVLPRRRRHPSTAARTFGLATYACTMTGRRPARCRSTRRHCPGRG